MPIDRPGGVRALHLADTSGLGKLFWDRDPKQNLAIIRPHLTDYQALPFLSVGGRAITVRSKAR